MTRDIVAQQLFRLPPAVRLALVLGAAVLIHLTLGTYHTFGNMLPYMASYMRNYTDSSVKIENLMWIPMLQGCFPFAMLIGGALSLQLGARAAALIGCTICTLAYPKIIFFSLGVFLSSYAIKYSLAAFTLTYGLLFGLGEGIGYVVAVTCVINWAPDRVGLVSGIVAAGFGLSSSIFAPIQTALVNPWNHPASKEGYFPQDELLQRVPPVFVILAIIYAVMQGIGLIILCDPPVVDGTRKRTVSGSSDEPVISSDDDESSPTSTVSLTPREMLASPTFYALFAALFCCSFYANMVYNLYKTYAETFISDDFFLALCFSLSSVANAAARIGWGYLSDKTSFQVLCWQNVAYFQLTIAIACCSATFLLLTMPLTQFIGTWAYLIWLILLFICMAATHALFITAAVKCFGPRYKGPNYGLLILSTTCSGIVLSIASEYYLSVIGYSWAFIITSCFPFCAFILAATIQHTQHGHLIC